MLQRKAPAMLDTGRTFELSTSLLTFPLLYFFHFFHFSHFFHFRLYLKLSINMMSDSNDSWWIRKTF